MPTKSRSIGDARIVVPDHFPHAVGDLQVVRFWRSRWKRLVGRGNTVGALPGGKRWLRRAPLQAQPFQRDTSRVPGPLPDRGEPPGSGHHRAHRHRDQSTHRVPDTMPTARIRYPGEQLDEELMIRGRRAGRRRDERRWHDAGVIRWSDGKA